MTKHKLAIVGGGFLGAELAKELESKGYDWIKDECATTTTT
jgi:NADH dehydrogenase FAD-containing subunit